MCTLGLKNFVTLLRSTAHILLAGQQTPELPYVGAGPRRFCGTDSKRKEHVTWGSAQSCHRCGRVLWRDAVCLVQDEIPQCCCRVRC